MRKCKSITNTFFKDEEEEEVQEKASEAEATLTQLKESMAANDGRIEESLIIDLLKQKLESKPVLNKGYVLDGYPKTYAQAKTIFEEMDEEGEPQGKPAANKVPEMSKLF
jgi:adenylate kinase